MRCTESLPQATDLQQMGLIGDNRLQLWSPFGLHLYTRCHSVHVFHERSETKDSLSIQPLQENTSLP